MRYEILLKINNLLLIIAVVAIVTLLILYYAAQKDIGCLETFIFFQQKEIKKLSELPLRKEAKTFNTDEVVKEMLDNMTFEEAVDTIEAIKAAGSYGNEYAEAITSKFWDQYHERCARGEECTKK